MFTVDSFAPDTYITFKDSIIDVRGNFFQSLYPVNLVFDNCIFRVALTTNLISLDYSSPQGNYGCTGKDLDGGDLSLLNS